MNHRKILEAAQERITDARHACYRADFHGNAGEVEAANEAYKAAVAEFYAIARALGYNEGDAISA